jgi:hypothetical protein
MTVSKTWIEEPKVFKFVSEALEEKAIEFDALVMSRAQSGGVGFIRINLNGKVYRLGLEEEI